MTDKLSMFIPLTKVNLEKREVWGRATQEVLDGHKEIMDYTSSVPYFKEWSGTVEKRSQGKSKGNLRSMHQPIAAGKLIAIDFNDVEKAIDIGTYVADDKEWDKVLQGVYTGFSVGGDYAKRWSDGSAMGVTRYTAKPHEISLVDAPAVPTATFEMVKADGVVELRKFAGEQSGENSVPIEVAKADVGETEPQLEVEKAADDPVSEIKPEDGDLEKSHQVIMPGMESMNQVPVPGTNLEGDVLIEAGKTEGALPSMQGPIEEVLSGDKVTAIAPNGAGRPSEDDGRVRSVEPSLTVAKAETPENLPEWVEKFKAAVKDFSTSIEMLGDLRKQAAEEQEKVTADLVQRGERVGIPRREGSQMTPSDGYSTDFTKYADPANWQWALDTPAHVGAAVASYNLRKGKAGYTAREWNILGRRIARMASDFGVAYQFNPTDKKVELIKKEKPMTTDKDAFEKADVMGLLRQVAGQLNEACDKIGSDPEAARSLLTQAMAAMDVADDVSTISPATKGALPKNETVNLGDPQAPADAVPANVKKDGVPAETTVAKAEEAAPEKADDPAPEKAKDEAVAKADAPATDEGENKEMNDTDKTQTDETKVEKAADPNAALMELIQQQSDMLKSLTEQVNALQKSAEANPGDVPVGDLAAIINRTGPESEGELYKALDKGDLREAFQVVGNDPMRLYEQANDIFVKSIAMSGINVQKFGIMPLGSLIEEPEQK